MGAEVIANGYHGRRRARQGVVHEKIVRVQGDRSGLANQLQTTQWAHGLG